MVLRGRDVTNVHLTYPVRVTLELTKRNPSGATHTVRECPKKVASRARMGGAGPDEPDTRAFLLPKVNLPDGVEPQNGDRLTETADGTVWIIQSITVRVGGYLFDCQCVKR